MSTWIHTKERRPTTADLPVWFVANEGVDIYFESIPFPLLDYYWMPAKLPEPPKTKRSLSTINDYAEAYGELRGLLLHLAQFELSSHTAPGFMAGRARHVIERARALGHLDL